MSARALKATTLCLSFSCREIAHICDTLSWIETDDMNRDKKDIAVDAICLQWRERVERS